MVKLYFLGTDKRSIYLREMYEKENKEGVEITDNLNEANIVITPIPFSKDRVHITGESIDALKFISNCKDKLVIGGALKAFKREFEQQNIEYIDLMELDSIAYLNAIPTAEGAILKAIEHTDCTIHGANVLVVGFGRVGKILADKLNGLNANVFCEARNEKDLAHINALGYNVVELTNMMNVLDKMDIIFSTVPTMILNREELKQVNKDTVIIDLASAPGSVDYDVCRELGINAYLELALPTKVAPKSAAKYLKEEIDRIIYRRI